MVGVATYACVDKTHPLFELLIYVCTYVYLTNYIECQIKCCWTTKMRPKIVIQQQAKTVLYSVIVGFMTKLWDNVDGSRTNIVI